MLEFPDWGLHLHFNFHMVSGLWQTHVLNFGSLLWLRRCKEYPYSSSPYLGPWGCWRFMIRVWHLGHDLDRLMNLDWSFSEIPISLILVKVSVSTIPQIHILNHFTLYHHELCINPLSICNWPGCKIVQWCFVVWLFEYQHLQVVCLLISSVKALDKSNHEC